MSIRRKRTNKAGATTPTLLLPLPIHHPIPPVPFHIVACIISWPIFDSMRREVRRFVPSSENYTINSRSLLPGFPYKGGKPKEDKKQREKGKFFLHTFGLGEVILVVRRVKGKGY